MGIQVHGVRRVVLAAVSAIALAAGGAAVTESVATCQINLQTDTFKKTFADLCKSEAIASGINEDEADAIISKIIEQEDKNISETIAKESKGLELPSVNAAKRYATWIKEVAAIAIKEAYQKGLSSKTTLDTTMNHISTISKKLIKKIKI